MIGLGQVALFMGIGGVEIVLIVAVLALVFGAQKIPEIARTAGEGLGEFQRGIEESQAGAVDTAGEETVSDGGLTESEREPGRGGASGGGTKTVRAGGEQPHLSGEKNDGASKNESAGEIEEGKTSDDPAGDTDGSDVENEEWEEMFTAE